MRIGRKFQVAFLFFVVFGVFYPAIFSSFNSVDDQKMLSDVSAFSNPDFISLFYPSSGFYYRPFVMITYIVDHYFWGDDPSFFHLTNISIHSLNVCLVFWLVVLLTRFRGDFSEGDYWPFLAALLFAVHPITTESVDWVSGRTDLLGTLFVLLTALSLLYANIKKQIRYIVLGVVYLVCAILSKEVMVFFLLPAAFLLWRSSCPLEMCWRNRALKVLLTPFFILGGCYFLLRLFLYSGGVGFHALLENYKYGVIDTARVSFKVFGFYVKKMVAPLPLNFAISNVSDSYVWLGLIFAALVIGMLLLKRLEFDFLVISCVLILPGILIALTSIAWTPLAERYVYLPTAFFVIGVILTVKSFSRGKNVYIFCFAGMLLPMSAITVDRNLIWQDNGLLYADSIKKNPKFAAMNNELAIALIESGNLNKASELLTQGKKLPSATASLYINQSRIYLKQNEFQKARDEILKICPDKWTANIEALKMLARIDEYRLQNEKLSKVLPGLIDTYRYLSARNIDPFFDYRLAQFLLKAGDKQAALNHFTAAWEGAPKDAYYWPAAGKFVQRLSAELQ